MATKIDFKKLNSELLSQAHYLLSQWLPGGRVIGSEYTCGDLSGGEGQSLKININTGLWCDFATDVKGGDLISLFAAIHGMSQVEAARELSGKAEVSPSSSLNPARSSQQTKKLVELVMPTSPLTRFKHSKLGIPSKTWAYYNETGQLCFYISRYETPKGKEFRPWSFNADGKWCNKAWPDNRPLLNVLTLRDGKPVLIVEGEKACDAARVFLGGTYDVVTWVGGAQAISKTNWTPIHGRKILIWPDQDQAGIGAGNRIADLLFDHCPEVKLIDVSGLEQDGSDAADYDFNYKTWAEWAKPLVKVYERPVEPEVVDNLPAMPEPPSGWEANSAPLSALEAAIDMIDQGPLTKENRELIMRDGLSTTTLGAPQCNADNMTRVFSRNPDFKDNIWYDTFFNKLFIDKKNPREWSDSDAISIMIQAQKLYGMHKLSETAVNQAAIFYGQLNKRNFPLDWMKSLKWDQVPRVAGFLSNYMGADDSEYSRAVSKNMFVAIAARVFSPGCKFDNMVILEGDQGKFKSTALSVLAGDGLFAEAEGDIGSKDFALCLQGSLIVEIGELDSFTKAEVRTIKKVLSCRVDRFRPPYGRNIQSFPRQGIIVGTTNDTGYLKDPTGARRFWPIKTRDINIDAIKSDREQLFAEAVHLYNQGEMWWNVPESAKQEQDHRQEIGGWDEIIEDYLIGKSQVTLREIMAGPLDLPIEKMSDKRHLNEIARVLRRLSWSSEKPEKLNGVTVRIFRPETPVTNLELHDASKKLVTENREETMKNLKAISDKKKLFNYATNKMDEL